MIFLSGGYLGLYMACLVIRYCGLAWLPRRRLPEAESAGILTGLVGFGFQETSTPMGGCLLGLVWLVRALPLCLA